MIQFDSEAFFLGNVGGEAKATRPLGAGLDLKSYEAFYNFRFKDVVIEGMMDR